MHKVQLPEWLRDGTRPGYQFADLDPARTALLVIDLQVVFVDEGQFASTQEARDIIPNVNRLTDSARKAGVVVIYTRQSTSDIPPYKRPDWHERAPMVQKLAPLIRPGRPEHQLHAGLHVEPADLVIDKYRSSAFLPNSCNLHEILQERKVDTVIITGCVTNFCCENTARDASGLDYRVFFISDATAAFTDQEHNSALTSIAAFGDIRPTEEMLPLL